MTTFHRLPADMGFGFYGATVLCAEFYLLPQQVNRSEKYDHSCFSFGGKCDWCK